MRLRLPTFLETAFAAAAVAMACYAVVPTVRKARDGARVDLAARSLVECDRAVRHLLRTHSVTNENDITLELVMADRRDAGSPEPVWPAGTDLSSFVPSRANGCTIRVALADGTVVLVSAASNRVDHAN